MGDADAWPWPDSLDALVAAAGTHRLVFENEEVRVLDTTISPGETTELHTHRWPGVLYVLSSADFVRRDGDGSVLTDTRESGAPPPGAAFWVAAMPPHTLENVGATDVRVINVELKNG